jgi:hypothetical protein
MEMFNAADEEQWAVITRTIDQCDYCVVIVAHRYGSTTPKGISFTEKSATTQFPEAFRYLVLLSTRTPRGPLTGSIRTRAAKALKHFKSQVNRKSYGSGAIHQCSKRVAVSLAQSTNLNPRRG